MILGIVLDSAADNIVTATGRWLESFERAAAAGDWPAVGALFHGDSHGRDAVALTWDIQAVSGAAEISAAFEAHLGLARASNFEIDPDRTDPRHVARAGNDAIEAFFRFETAAGGPGRWDPAPDPGR